MGIPPGKNSEIKLGKVKFLAFAYDCKVNDTEIRCSVWSISELPSI